MTCLETALRYPAPIAAYPIMIGSDGVLIPVASLGFLKSGRFAPGATLGLAIGGVVGTRALCGLRRQAPATIGLPQKDGRPVSSCFPFLIRFDFRDQACAYMAALAPVGCHNGLLRFSVNDENMMLKLMLIRSSSLALASTECCR